MLRATFTASYWLNFSLHQTLYNQYSQCSTCKNSRIFFLKSQWYFVCDTCKRDTNILIHANDTNNTNEIHSYYSLHSYRFVYWHYIFLKWYIFHLYFSIALNNRDFLAGTRLFFITQSIIRRIAAQLRTHLHSLRDNLCFIFFCAIWRIP